MSFKVMYRTKTVFVDVNGNCANHVIPPEAKIGKEIPESFNRVNSFDTGETVRAMAITTPPAFLFTGGQGSVKMWEINQQVVTNPWRRFDCPKENSLIDCVKLTANDTLIAGGVTNTLSIWDVNAPQTRTVLPLNSPECNCLVISPDSKMFFSCHHDGTVSVWDLHNQYIIRKFLGHEGGTTCLDMSGNTLVTGGMEEYVRFWDLRNYSERQNMSFMGEINSICCSPNSKWMAVGAGFKNLEFVHPNEPARYLFCGHANSVLCLKFASSGKWLVSGGKDDQLNGWTVPDGASLFRKNQTSQVMCCEIFMDDRFMMIGTGDHVKLYDVAYPVAED